MTKDKTHIPELRFPEFQNDGEWEIKALGDLVYINSGKDYKHLDFGDIPVYGTGGYMLSVNDKLSDVDAIGIGRKGTIDKPQYLKAPFWTVDTLFFLINKNTYNIRFLYYLSQTIDWKRYSEQTGLPSLSKTTIQRINVIIPIGIDKSIIEQQKIANCLTSLDSYIEATKYKLDQLKEHKKGLMQRLFPANGKTLPELRFSEFQNEGEWNSDTMEVIFDIKNGYTPSKLNPSFWENGTIPWFRMEDIRENGHILSDSIQHITPAAVKGAGLFPANSIIVSTTATIGEHALIIVDSLANQRFTFLSKRKSFDNKIDMMYFHYFMFIVDEWCKRNTNAGGLVAVNMNSFKKLVIPYPSSLLEQKKIAECFVSIDKQIDATKHKFEHLKKYKRGLMQQLFPKI